MTSLRAQLIGGVEDRPGFAVLLPDGWEFAEGSDKRFTAEAEDVIRTLPHEARTRLEPGLRELLRQAQSSGASNRMEVAGVVRQVDVAPEQYLPMSLIFNWFTPPTGATVQEFGGRLIQQKSAAPMPDAPGVLRWIDEQTVSVEGESGVFGGPSYLIAHEGKKRLALLIKCVLPVPENPDEDVTRMQAMAYLMADSIVGTLRWRRDDD